MPKPRVVTAIFRGRQDTPRVAKGRAGDQQRLDEYVRTTPLRAWGYMVDIADREALKRALAGEPEDRATRGLRYPADGPDAAA